MPYFHAMGVDVSIHAPARGATQQRATAVVEARRFNPRSREGSDALSDCGCYERHCFNPRSREGSDSVGSLMTQLASNVSIHAPARGATPTAEETSPIQVQFQSTLPRGERPDNVTFSQHINRFQSTLPRGERRRIYIPWKWLASFNPRSREGSDRQGLGGSIFKVRFNPRSREGSDRPNKHLPTFNSSFNPRSREGSDRWAATFVEVNLKFQSTLPRGERRDFESLR